MNNKEKENKIEQILDECLELILIEGLSIEDCLQKYPAYEEELKTLLGTAGVVKEVCKETPRAKFKAQARREFLEAVHQKTIGKRKGFSFSFMHRWATVAASAVLLFVLSGGGLVLASDGSMPDSPLYRVKLAVEKVALAITLSDEGKIELNAELADKRIDEILYLAENGNAQDIYSVNADLQVRFDNINILTLENKMLGGSDAFCAPSQEESAILGLEDGRNVDDSITIETSQLSKEDAAILEDAQANLDSVIIAIQSAEGDMKEALEEVFAALLSGYQSYINSLD